MSNIRQSFAWWCFGNKGVEDRALLAGAAKIGYAGVEFLGEELWPLAREAGLSITAIAGHGSIEDGCNRRENAGRIETELRKNIEKAAAWNIPVLICFSGNRHEATDAEGARVSAEVLLRVADEAAKAGVVLAMELLNSKVDHRGYQCDHTAWGIEFCRQADAPAIKLLYDIYHMQIMEGDIIRTIAESHAWFAHYHTAGNPGRGPMDQDQELNYRGIYKAIAKTDYRGFIGHEFVPSGDPLRQLEKAFQECREALTL